MENRCKRCGGSTLEVDKYDVLGKFGETNRKCISCGHEQKTTQSAERMAQSEKGREGKMAQELTEEEKEKRRAYQREWYKNNSKWARRKVGKDPVAPGDAQKEGQMAECKYHAGVLAVVDKGGRTTGLCKECLSARAGKARGSQKKKSSAKRPRRTLPAKVGARCIVPLPPIVAEHKGKIFIPTAQLVQPAAELRFELIYKLADARVLSKAGYRS